MRQLISGIVAAFAVTVATPAMACGFSPCGYSYGPWVQPRYVAPVAAFDYSYSNYGSGYGCGGCGWATERLAEPTTQYYYVNQGPTFSGPGNWAPQPTYYEPSVSGWSAYSRPYGYGYVPPRAYGPTVYGYGAWRYNRPSGAYRYGYVSRYHGRAVRRYY